MRLTLNVGCGTRTFIEYPDGYKCINYDERKLDCVDVVGDVRKLDFPDNYFENILASDIIEHFPISETVDIITEWKRVLKVGGIIEFRMPNLRAICKKYIDGVHDAKMASWLLYGGQDYSGNFHYVGFDREFFKSVAEPLGLIEVEYKDADNNFEIKMKKV